MTPRQLDVPPPRHAVISRGDYHMGDTGLFGDYYKPDPRPSSVI
jgi:hypothetical protein